MTTSDNVNGEKSDLYAELGLSKPYPTRLGPLDLRKEPYVCSVVGSLLPACHVPCGNWHV